LENKKRLTITLSSQVLEYLSETAKNKGLSKSALITVALEKYKEGQKQA
jgi:predicted DNA binding CopG/RHH family protein